MLISKNIYGNQKNIFKELKKSKNYFLFLRKHKKNYLFLALKAKEC